MMSCNGVASEKTSDCADKKVYYRKNNTKFGKKDDHKLFVHAPIGKKFDFRI